MKQSIKQKQCITNKTFGLYMSMPSIVEGNQVVTNLEVLSVLHA